MSPGLRKKLGSWASVTASSKGPTQLEFQLGLQPPDHVRRAEGITFAVEGPDKLTVQGIDKQLVGEVAANIQAAQARTLQGQGRSLRGEHIRRKAGKAGK